MISSLLNIYLYLLGSLLLGVILVHLIPHLGKVGQLLADSLCEAPGIDLALAYFTLMPVIVGSIFASWSGFGIGLAAEASTLLIWVLCHELAHRELLQQAKIHRTMSRIVGGWRNHLALWITLLAVPGFWVVRFTEIIAYPPVAWLVGMPKYQTKDWINVSRHKFVGLVGYDLIWCLYCDWMTGVWSLGTEMLRNIESFWCPIRFYSDKKCENCKLDFPDIDNGWVVPDGNMNDVVTLLEQKYGTADGCSWFGHPSRPTTNEKPDVDKCSE